MTTKSRSHITGMGNQTGFHCRPCEYQKARFNNLNGPITQKAYITMAHPEWNIIWIVP